MQYYSLVRVNFIEYVITAIYNTRCKVHFRLCGIWHLLILESNHSRYSNTMQKYNNTCKSCALNIKTESNLFSLRIMMVVGCYDKRESNFYTCSINVIFIHLKDQIITVKYFN